MLVRGSRSDVIRASGSSWDLDVRGSCRRTIVAEVRSRAAGNILTEIVHWSGHDERLGLYRSLGGRRKLLPGQEHTMLPTTTFRVFSNPLANSCGDQSPPVVLTCMVT